ncbi:hypothetical protein HDU93_004816, partial [Gonapodya sp. JEL0774]
MTDNAALAAFQKWFTVGNILPLSLGSMFGTSASKTAASLATDVVVPFLGLFTDKLGVNQWTITLRPEYVSESGDHVAAITVNLGAFISRLLELVITVIFMFLGYKLIESIVALKGVATEDIARIRQ